MFSSHPIILFCLLILSPLAFSKLEMVLEVFRHGAREPLDRPFDPSDWTEFQGELTLAGMRQHYLLGKEMRKRYIEQNQLLSQNFNHSELYVRSTDVNRTIMSVQSHLMGLYPLGTGSKFPNDYPLDRAIPPYQTKYDIQDLGFSVLPGRYQPIPVHVVEGNGDFLLLANMVCPNYNVLYDAQKETETYKEFNEKYDSFFKEVVQVFNLTKNLTISSLGSLTSDLYCSIMENAEMPKGLTEEVLRNMSRLKDLEVQFVDVGTDMQRKILSTPFFKNLLQSFQAKINDTTPLKYIMLSAHDTTLQPFMAALNLTSWECILEQIETNEIFEMGNCVPGYPIFASQILFELHSNTTKDGQQSYFVKVIYNGVEMKLCESEQTECSFSEFNQRINDYVLDDDSFAENCGNDMILNVPRTFLKKKKQSYL